MEQRKCGQDQHISCQNCSISELCLPFSLNDEELHALDSIIDRKRPIHKGDQLYHDGESLHSLFAIRAGTFKTFTVDEHGEQQITGFHLAGDLLGFDAIADSEHPSFAQALETAMVCEIPYNTLDALSNDMPKLNKQILRLMSNEIKSDQQMLTLLNKKNAEQRVATFLATLSKRYHARGLSASEFRLTMTRGDIGNYLGLTVETISRLLNRFHKVQLIHVDGKLIRLLDIEKLNQIALL